VSITFFGKAGNKIDLREDLETINKLKDRGQSPITTEQGRQLAKEIGAVAYVENRFSFIKKLTFFFSITIIFTIL
jgi:hypothetical protein